MMWSDEQSLELISLYQEKPVIWDPKNPQYYKKNLKHDAWSDIAHSLERDVEECKNKMISLLASHRREKGKVKKSHSSGKGGDETYKSTWFAYEALAFLGDRNNPRKRRNTEITNEPEQSASTSVENDNSSEFISPTGQAPKKKKSDENKKMGMLSEALGLLKSAASSPTPEPRNNNPNNFDSETLFFSNFICSKMQQYNRSTKNAVQRAIMDVIFKADEGCTNFSQHYYPSAFNYSEISLELKGHGGPAYRCRFFPSGIVVLSAGADGSCRIWSAESGINPVILKGHTMAVSDICILEKGRNVVSVSKDGSAKLWDVGESNCLGNVVEGHGQINCCAVATTSEEVEVENDREVGTHNKLLIVGCESGLVVCAHVAKRAQLYTKQLDSACNAVIVLDQAVIVGCSNGKITKLNLQDGSVLIEWHESANPVLSLAALTNHMYVVGRQDGTCTVLSLDEGSSKLRVQLTGSDCDGIRDLAFNGKWVFAGCRDSNVRKYDFNQINVHFK